MQDNISVWLVVLYKLFLYLKSINLFQLLLCVLTVQVLINVISRYPDSYNGYTTIITPNEKLDENFVKKGIYEDLKNEVADIEVVPDGMIDDSIKFVENQRDWIYRLDYNKSHPFDNECRFPVIKHG